MKVGDYKVSDTDDQSKFEVSGDMSRLLKHLIGIGFKGSLWLIIMKMHMCARGAQAAYDLGGDQVPSITFESGSREQIINACNALGANEIQSQCVAFQ